VNKTTVALWYEAEGSSSPPLSSSSASSSPSGLASRREASLFSDGQNVQYFDASARNPLDGAGEADPQAAAGTSLVERLGIGHKGLSEVAETIR
jgi:hypothetical protein